MIPDSPASFSSFSDDSSDFIVADINSSSDEEYEASPNASAFSTYSPGGQEDEDEDEESSLTSCCDDDQDSERSPPPLPSLPCCASRNPSKEASAATIEEFRGLPTLEMIDWLETKQLLGVRVKAHMQRNRYTGLSIDTFHMGETLPAGMTPGMRHELEELSRFVHEHFNAAARKRRGFTTLLTPSSTSGPHTSPTGSSSATGPTARSASAPERSSTATPRRFTGPPRRRRRPPPPPLAPSEAPPAPLAPLPGGLWLVFFVYFLLLLFYL